MNICMYDFVVKHTTSIMFARSIIFFAEKTHLTNVIDIEYKDTNEVYQNQIEKIKFL